MSHAPIRVLIVAYHYPPVGGGYSERVTGYVKYLTRMPCEVYVLAGDCAGLGFPQDPERLEQVERVKRVWRVKDFHQSRWFRPLRLVGAGRVARKAVSFLSCPDEQRLWSRRALATARGIVGDHAIDLALTSSAPYSAHLVGMRLKEEFPRLKWVADFRDPMTTHYAYQRLVRTCGWHRKARRMEASIYDAADRVIFNTPLHLRDIVSLFALPPDKSVCLPNGYDPEMLPAPGDGTVRPGEKLQLFYVSGLRGDWFEGPFYRAMALLKKQSPQSYRRLAVHFVGANGFPGDLPRQLGIDRDIVMHGFVPQSALNPFYEQADALLLLLPAAGNAAGCVPQKLYSYLYLRKPVFAVIPPGQAADYVASTGSGAIVPPDDPQAIAVRLGEWIERFAAGRLAVHRTAQADEQVRTLGKPCLAETMFAMFRELVP